jgi:pilus assembly protein Flp/PilA
MITRYNFLKSWILAQVKDERAASLVEYALLVALIAVVCIGAVTLIGTNANTMFTGVADKL